MIKDSHCGFVAVLGAPNAGKSTLTNFLVGSKVSIVTPKAQTTRARIRGVASHGAAQLVLIDTPGIFNAGKKFERGMVEEAWAGAGDADAILLLIDAERGLDEQTQAILEKLSNGTGGVPAAIALNKVDAVKKPFLLKLATLLGGYSRFEQIFMISALSGDGVAALKEWLAAKMPAGAWHYPEDQPTDQSLRDIAAEITREKLFLLLRQELPYSLMVEPEKWEEEGGRVHISQAIVVERESQKKIVIGHQGETLKRVGTSARQEINRVLGIRAHLTLFVKVEEKWKEKQGKT